MRQAFLQATAWFIVTARRWLRLFQGDIPAGLTWYQFPPVIPAGGPEQKLVNIRLSSVGKKIGPGAVARHLIPMRAIIMERQLMGRATRGTDRDIDLTVDRRPAAIRQGGGHPDFRSGQITYGR